MECVQQCPCLPALEGCFGRVIPLGTLADLCGVSAAIRAFVAGVGGRTRNRMKPQIRNGKHRPPPGRLIRRVHPEREPSSLSRAERWLFGLLFASTLAALAQQILVARHFAERMPEIAERVRHWFTAAV